MISLRKPWHLFIIVATLLALTGCTKSSTVADGSNGVGGNGTTGIYGGAGGSGSGAYGDDPLYGTRGTADRVIYFDYDSDNIRADSKNVVQAHAQEMVSNASRGVLLEGHTDDRGSREYNIGLGERRANAVRQLMNAYGVNSSQIRTISYGKERPAVSGSDEGAWAHNRRVEIVY